MGRVDSIARVLIAALKREGGAFNDEQGQPETAEQTSVKTLERILVSNCTQRETALELISELRSFLPAPLRRAWQTVAVAAKSPRPTPWRMPTFVVLPRRF